MLEGLGEEESMSALCRRKNINQNLYRRWSKELLGAGERRLAGDTAREATSEEVKAVRAEASWLEEMLAEPMMESRLLK